MVRLSVLRMTLYVYDCEQYLIVACLVPEVNVQFVNITVPEGDPDVEICFDLSTGITERVVVTAQTGPKAGAANPATGIYSLPLICNYLWHF